MLFVSYRRVSGGIVALFIISFFWNSVSNHSHSCLVKLKEQELENQAEFEAVCRA